MSLPETMLWNELRKRPGGLKFRRQHGIDEYVLDFYCAAARLDIEVDGKAHDNAPRRERDGERSEFLRSFGIATTRIPAELVLRDMEAVLVRIIEICEGRMSGQVYGKRVDRTSGKPLHQPAAGPPPRSGEDL